MLTCLFFFFFMLMMTGNSRTGDLKWNYTSNLSLEKNKNKNWPLTRTRVHRITIFNEKKKKKINNFQENETLYIRQSIQNVC